MSTTEQVDKILTGLIKEHGVERVRQDLNALLPRGRWEDWQRLVNLTDAIYRKQQTKGNEQ